MRRTRGTREGNSFRNRRDSCALAVSCSQQLAARGEYRRADTRADIGIHRTDGGCALPGTRTKGKRGERANRESTIASVIAYEAKSEQRALAFKALVIRSPWLSCC